MSIYKCEYCNKEFQRKYNLQVHQKRTQYCLARQELACRSPVQLPESNMQTQKMLFDLIKQLQQTIEKLTDNQRNVVLQNLTPVTDEEIQEHLDHLTLDFICQGAKGYANFANYYPFKNRILCTDRARKKLKYRNHDGEIIEDSGGIKLVQRFFRARAPRNEEIINAEYRTLQEEVRDIAAAGTAYTTNLTKATKLQSLLISCQEAARGEENELTKEFVNH